MRPVGEGGEKWDKGEVGHHCYRANQRTRILSTIRKNDILAPYVIWKYTWQAKNNNFRVLDTPINNQF